MKHPDLSYFPTGTASILVLITGITVMTDMSTELMKAINFDPLIYSIITMIFGLIFVVWFIHEIRLSYTPRSI
ncbi:hypothetical protein MCP_2251 [Methanocella paludicola SANAE]|uniref:Uncharacterized protein n=1 Tax=Methanocella paludicola (strain DSM 17711 / JCM 13418 / NBRC 101707 / SANAE) TaxID=304371 RepID=D1Z0V1_METPS|nr:hypothetical protein [Methanocella paludicola]BAI62323.1 hypothetical protein MCP_2251 [Methanocella paludicola SANAE]